MDNTNPASAEKAAAELGVPKVFAGVADLVAPPEIDIVIVKVKVSLLISTEFSVAINTIVGQDAVNLAGRNPYQAPGSRFALATNWTKANLLVQSMTA